MKEEGYGRRQQQSPGIRHDVQLQASIDDFGSDDDLPTSPNRQDKQLLKEAFGGVFEIPPEASPPRRGMWSKLRETRRTMSV
jgi:hypothetical protein